MAKLKKPASIERDPVKSDKWDEITKSREFRESDVPTLCLLCQWHKIAQECMDDMDDSEGLIYVNEMNDIKALPQIEIMKKASAEIRQLNKQLGINDEAKPAKPKKPTVITKIINDRARKAAGA